MSPLNPAREDMLPMPQEHPQWTGNTNAPQAHVQRATSGQPAQEITSQPSASHSSMDRAPPPHAARPPVNQPGSDRHAPPGPHRAPASAHRNTAPQSRPPAPRQPASYTPPAAPSSSQSQSEAFHYLQRVKVQFQDQADIYDEFLDIMKDFKAQSIDTPGVIERVAKLLTGHPDLITGFNTFLPIGYRVDCLRASNGTQLIRITTPTGVKTRMANGGSVATVPRPQAAPIPAPMSHSGHNPHDMRGREQYSTNDPHAYRQQASSTNSMTATRQSTSRPPARAGNAGGPLEFGQHAIKMIHRIKDRFAHNPDIYRDFVDLLRMYQEDKKSISQVRADVGNLFRNDPDLMEEFVRFLPVKPGDQGNPRLSSRALPSQVHNNELTATGKKKRGPSASSEKAFAEVAGKGKKRAKHGAGTDANASSSATTVTMRYQGDPEDLVFFDKVQKFLPNRHTYNEFLKLLNLFSQEILDRNMLVEKMESFLAPNKELMDRFKKLVGWEGSGDELVHVTEHRQKVDLSTCRRYGESYRLLPKSETTLPCSGRDEMCWEVLNDIWASHPSWSVEGEGFMAHKKNAYEEALHKNEEDRYEFDMNIEANLHTIALLEPIAKQIQSMTLDEQARFKLPEGLGGSSKTIYQRNIKTIYDKERGQDMIDALHNNPVMAVPVVLKRLRQKDDEWKKSQREWNRVWRDVDTKNYYKALDHQGLTFKAADKKMIVSKSLVAEIEILYREQISRSHHAPLARPTFQFRFLMEDQSSFQNTDHVLSAYLTRHGGGGGGGNGAIPAQERDSMKRFLQVFMPQFFSLAGLAGDAENAALSAVASSSASTSLSAPRVSSHKFFGNNSIYCFFRLYQLVYSRLESIKVAASEVSDTGSNAKSANSAAANLGLKDARADGGAGACFTKIMGLLDKFLNGEVESPAFEERTRHLLPTRAYVLFTMDKVIQALVKHVQMIVTDQQCIELTALYERERRQESKTTSRQRIIARMQAEAIVEDDNLYSIEFVPETRELRIQLLSKNDYTTDAVISAEEKWGSYIDSYVLLTPTEGVASSLTRPTYLKRNRALVDRILQQRQEDEEEEDDHDHEENEDHDGGEEGKVTNNNKRILTITNMDNGTTPAGRQSGLQAKICINTYKIFYVQGTEDFFYRPRRSRPSASLKSVEEATAEMKARRLEKMEAWLKTRIPDEMAMMD